MKKSKLTTIASLLLTLVSHAQTFEWAKSSGSDTHDNGTSITVDPSGNVYTTGSFENTVDFDPGAGTANLTSAGDKDIFVLKLDASGNFIWAKSFGGINDDEGSSITVDSSGNVYTTGWFENTVDFDPGAGTATHTSAGASDIFVLKLDASGNYIWTKSFGGTSFDGGNSITVDASGNVYTTGYFEGTIDFDPGEGTANLVSSGQSTIFIQKLDTYGNFVWAKSSGFSNFAGGSGKSIDIDALGNVYTTGSFFNTVDFDPGAGVANFTSAGGSDIFVLKLDTSGNYIWAKTFGGTSFDAGFSITVDASGNVYTSGSFQGTADLNPGMGATNYTSEGYTDIFIQKLDAFGNFIWAYSFGDFYIDLGNSVTVDVSGNVYTIGYFTGTIDFDPGEGTTNLVSTVNQDIFVQKLDASGNFIWAYTFGGSNDDFGNSITVDALGNVYTTGAFENTVDFDPGADTANLTAASIFEDIFIQKMSQCTPTTSTDYKTNCTSYTWINGITYTASNDTATYTLVNSAGCDSVVTLNLTINSVSEINTSLDGLTLTAINSNATYQWLNCNTNFGIISDETNQTFTATTNGNFAVELTENGCVDTSSCVEITTVGILENTFCQEINVFPNPTSGKVRITFEEALNNAEITLTDLQGRIVFTQKLDVTKEALLEIEGDAGVYFLTIKTPNEKSLVKLVKK